jgi:hypothetical protein
LYLNKSRKLRRRLLINNQKIIQENDCPSPDGSGISRYRKTRLFISRSFYLSGIKRTSGISSKKNAILKELFRYIYATKINLCSFPKVETQPVGLSFSHRF